jgi:geranylgeranyl transferase type-2 subunit beta
VTSSGAHDQLAGLATACAEGLQRLPDLFLARNADYVRQAQNPDGGFPGRGQASDLYYTSFALRAADLLGIQDVRLWQGAAAYVRGSLPHVAGVVDCHCLLHAAGLAEMHGCRVWDREPEDDLRGCLLDVLARHRAPSGGFSKQAGGQASVYHTFLAALCHALLASPMPDGEVVLEIVRSRQQENGAFVDIPERGRESAGGVNATAAAVHLLSMSGALDPETGERAAAFLGASQREDGGLGAYPDAPVADLMSTFTGLATLRVLGDLDRVRLAPLTRFTRALAGTNGGFRATPLDDRTDLEYTYHGLGVLGIVGLHAANASCACGRCC